MPRRTFFYNLLSSSALRPKLFCPEAGSSSCVQSNVYVLIVTRGNSNAAAGFKLITEVISLFKAYFNAFDEDSLRNNFVLIYELLDGARRLHSGEGLASLLSLPRPSKSRRKSLRRPHLVRSLLPRPHIPQR